MFNYTRQTSVLILPKMAPSSAVWLSNKITEDMGLHNEVVATGSDGLSRVKMNALVNPVEAKRIYMFMKISLIASECFSVETLATRNNDNDDFHDVAVWSIEAALEQAFRAGGTAAKSLSFR